MRRTDFPLLENPDGSGMFAAALVGRDMGEFKLTTHCGGGGGLKAGFEAIAPRMTELSRDNRSVGSGSM